MTTTSRRTITVDGVTVCGNVQGSVPGPFLSVTNSVAGACPSDPPPPIPAGRLLVSDIYFPNTGGGTSRNQDVTEFKNIFGRRTPTDPLNDFPCDNGAAISIQSFPHIGQGYVGARFLVPAGVPRLFGNMKCSSYLGRSVLMSLSAHCGDFNPATSLQVKQVGPGEQGTQWSVLSLPGKALLVPGTYYFWNVRLENDTSTDRRAAFNISWGIAP